MSQIRTVGIVGLGLIGGSMAKTIKKRTLCKILAFDKNVETMRLAKDDGTIDGELSRKNLAECDLVMIAIYPGAIIEWVKEHKDYFGESTILVDLCGIKRDVVNSLLPISKEAGFKYVGGHPMAGKEVAGFKNASNFLYRDASMILTPDETVDEETMYVLKSFYLSLGFGEIVISTPEEHDRIISYTSQLAHITSSAYIKSPTSRQRMGFTAGSYKDMTRVARLDPDMWTELFMDNRENLEYELQELVDNLTEYLDALKEGDAHQLRKLLAEGCELKLTEPIENC